jgi:hypothetical protein
VNVLRMCSIKEIFLNFTNMLNIEELLNFTVMLVELIDVNLIGHYKLLEKRDRRAIK